jgi:hypothetical protein
VNPKFVNLAARGGLGWLAGFNECIVRCGMESNGAPGTDVLPSNTGEPTEMGLTLHGRVANLPAHRVEVGVLDGDPPEVVVKGVVDESMLFCPQFRLEAEYRTGVGSNRVTVADRVTNLRATPAEMQMLYHCNFGAPILEAGAALLIPSRVTAPRDAEAAKNVSDWAVYPGPTPGFVEQCYWHVPLGDPSGHTLAVLRNAAADRGVAVRYNTAELPYFTQWKNCEALSDGYVTGLEPATNLPNTRVFERSRGRVVELGAGESHAMTLHVEVLDSAAEVSAAAEEVAALQAACERVLHQEPQPTYSQTGH